MFYTIENLRGSFMNGVVNSFAGWMPSLWDTIKDQALENIDKINAKTTKELIDEAKADWVDSDELKEIVDKFSETHKGIVSDSFVEERGLILDIVINQIKEIKWNTKSEYITQDWTDSWINLKSERFIWVWDFWVDIDDVKVALPDYIWDMLKSMWINREEIIERLEEDEDLSNIKHQEIIDQIFKEEEAIENAPDINAVEWIEQAVTDFENHKELQKEVELKNNTFRAWPELSSIDMNWISEGSVIMLTDTMIVRDGNGIRVTRNNVWNKINWTMEKWAVVRVISAETMVKWEYTYVKIMTPKEENNGNLIRWGDEWWVAVKRWENWYNAEVSPEGEDLFNKWNKQESVTIDDIKVIKRDKVKSVDLTENEVDSTYMADKWEGLKESSLIDTTKDWAVKLATGTSEAAKKAYWKVRDWAGKGMDSAKWALSGVLNTLQGKEQNYEWESIQDILEKDWKAVVWEWTNNEWWKNELLIKKDWDNFILEMDRSNMNLFRWSISDYDITLDAWDLTKEGLDKKAKELFKLAEKDRKDSNNKPKGVKINFFDKK